MRMRNNQAQRGIILLVVLTTLTFFSILLAAYLVFSNQSRESSFAIASRNINRPDPNAILDDALMTLIRGTADENNPFFGEDLLSDYYGHKDDLDVTTSGVGVSIGAFSTANATGFARFEIAEPLLPNFDDVLSGRIVTFLDDGVGHGFENRTFRVLRSTFAGRHSIILDIGPALNPADVPANAPMKINGVPRNAIGIGYQQATGELTLNATPQTSLGGLTLPASLQPNHLRHEIPKSQGTDIGSDFDESYDAADFNNWFLSHRGDGTAVIPSFHRPAVINYLINQPGALSSRDDLAIAISRATFRPLPIHENHLRGVPALNERFTGGNANFGLRAKLDLNSTARLDQLLKALIRTSASAPPTWDVDNDSDGVLDSIWINLDLPLITSPEGKLLRPLVAPMIEDLSGRLNLNAIGSSQMNPAVAGITNHNSEWAGTLQGFGNPANSRNVFRGVGWGPAEISIPAVSSSGIVPSVTASITAILNHRYRFGQRPESTPDFPGLVGRDAVDLLRFGYRPPFHNRFSGYGYSTDPFGRRGIALGRSGEMISSVPPLPLNEAIDDPYELDPLGKLTGDSIYSLSDLEAILRSNDFDVSLLPSRLHAEMTELSAIDRIFANELRRSLTTISKSDETPSGLTYGTSAYLALRQLILDLSPTLSEAQIRRLIAPEIRLGRKIDINRAFGNGVDGSAPGVIGVDDDMNGTVDDNSERTGLNGVIDEPSEVVAELESFESFDHSVMPVPQGFSGQAPRYTFDEPATIAGDIPVTGRQLLARHLYVLMMALTRDIDSPTNEFLFPSLNAASMSPPERQLYKARRLAQWAVNVVDYRDPDSIMTRFVFDPTPFDANGWSTPDTFATPAIDAHVVWGVESPELMFSESLALHDVRLRDTQFDDNAGLTGADKLRAPGGMDPHSDQVRKPEGSLFLELYCPHSTVSLTDEATKRSLPRELYNAEGALDLGAVAPNGAPIWRIGISEAHSASPTADPAIVRATFPDSASFEVSNPDELGGFTDPTLNLDRFIWFGGTRTITGPVNLAAPIGYSSDFASSMNIGNIITANNFSDLTNQDSVFYASDATNGPGRRDLFPGQYLVIAPRSVTHLGSRGDGAGNPLYPSRQRFAALPAGFAHFRNGDGVSNPPTEVRTSPAFGASGPSHHTIPRTLLVGSFLPAGWTANSFQHGVPGLSVSEPLHSSYYPALPINRYNGTAAADQQDNDGFPGTDYPLVDAYLDLFDTSSTQSRDEPLDSATTILPLIGPEPRLGTIPTFCSAFLQRLSDPTQAYNPITNPYRTIDWMEIDLTVFNGEGSPGADMGQPNPFTAKRTRQRTGDGVGSLFSYTTNDVEIPGTQVIPDASLSERDFFHFSVTGSNQDRYLLSSLGFLNTETDSLATIAWPGNPALGHCNLNFNGFSPSVGSLPAASAIAGNDRNLPQTPFALHPWFNRPFATPAELLMVPACSQGRLFEEFSFVPGTDPAIFPSTATPEDPSVFQAPFRHLLNFFHSQSAGGAGAEFSKLFDFAGTLPPFRGEVIPITPSRLSSPIPAAEAELARLRSILPPSAAFNYDNHRVGTVNLNSLTEFQVWSGLMQAHLNAAEFTSIADTSQLAYENFLASRRGYSLPTTIRTVTDTSGPSPYNYDPNSLDPLYPTEFAGVFRRATETQFSIPLQDATANTLFSRRSANGGLLRGVGTLAINDPVSGTPTRTSLFVRAGTQAPNPTTRPEHDRFRNSMMKYQTLMRMPNLVSDNSQVFAIWLTLGLFEVDAANTDSLGAEYGESTGESQRYKALFIIDRSIPVGFVPGQDLNARDTVIFERFYQ